MDVPNKMNEATIITRQLNLTQGNYSFMIYKNFQFKVCMKSFYCRYDCNKYQLLTAKRHVDIRLLASNLCATLCSSSAQYVVSQRNKLLAIYKCSDSFSVNKRNGVFFLEDTALAISNTVQNFKTNFNFSTATNL